MEWKGLEMSCPKCKTMLQFKIEDMQGKFVCPKCGHKQDVEKHEVKL